MLLDLLQRVYERDKKDRDELQAREGCVWRSKGPARSRKRGEMIENRPQESSRGSVRDIDVRFDWKVKKSKSETYKQGESKVFH